MTRAVMKKFLVKEYFGLPLWLILLLALFQLCWLIAVGSLLLVGAVVLAVFSLVVGK